MPNQDHTGPAGRGPRTGRDRGLCRGNNTTPAVDLANSTESGNNSSQDVERGQEAISGRGRGNGWGWGWGGGRGKGNGGGRGRGRCNGGGQGRGNGLGRQ